MARFETQIKTKSQFFIGLLVALIMLSCSGQEGPSQFEGVTVRVNANVATTARANLDDGILHKAEFQTMACQPAEVDFILNNHKTNALKLKAVMLQAGSDRNGFYRIKSVYAAGRNYFGSNRLYQDILIEPRGQAKITVIYNPRAVTSIAANDFHTAVLDIIAVEPAVNSRQTISQLVFRGSTRFIKQDTEGVAVLDDNGRQIIENRKIQGCGEEVITPFAIKKITTYLIHNSFVGQPNPENETVIEAEGQFGFIIDENNSRLSMRGDGWPIISLLLPTPINGIASLDVITDSQFDIYGGTNDDRYSVDNATNTAQMTIGGINLSVGGLIPIADVKLTSRDILLEAGDLPQSPDGLLVPTGSYSIVGEDLNLDTGLVTLVLAVPLDNPLFETQGLQFGVFAARIELELVEE